MLPEVLKKEIFQFDNTYHSVFKKTQFRQELCLKQLFINNRTEFTKQFHDQLDTIIEMIFYNFDSGLWRNEYGVFSFNFYEEEQEYDYYGHGYRLKFYPEDNDIIKFKILPIYPDAEDVFLNSAMKKYDGFICSPGKHRLFRTNLFPLPMEDTFCQYDEITNDFAFVIYLAYSIAT